MRNWLILETIVLFAILATVGVFYHLNVVNRLNADKTSLNTELGVLKSACRQIEETAVLNQSEAELNGGMVIAMTNAIKKLDDILMEYNKYSSKFIDYVVDNGKFYDSSAAQLQFNFYEYKTDELVSEYEKLTDEFGEILVEWNRQLKNLVTTDESKEN